MAGGTQTWAQRFVRHSHGHRGGRVRAAAVRLLWERDSAALRNSLQVQTHKQKCHCVAFHQHRASALTDIVFAFPLPCIFRMIIVWHIQYVNIIIVRGTGPVIMEQEVTCQDPWWPQRESDDLRLTLVFVPGCDCDRGRSAALLTGEERAIGGVTLKHALQQCAGNSLWGASFLKTRGHQSRLLFWDVGMIYYYLYVSRVFSGSDRLIMQFCWRGKKASKMVKWYFSTQVRPLLIN